MIHTIIYSDCKLQPHRAVECVRSSDPFCGCIYIYGSLACDTTVELKPKVTKADCNDLPDSSYVNKLPYIAAENPTQIFVGDSSNHVQISIPIYCYIVLHTRTTCVHACMYVHIVHTNTTSPSSPLPPHPYAHIQI